MGEAERGRRVPEARLLRRRHCPRARRQRPRDRRRDRLRLAHCPGRKAAVFLAVKRPARPYKRAIENRSTQGSAEGRLDAPGAARTAAVARAEACAAEGKGVKARTAHCAALRAGCGADLCRRASVTTRTSTTGGCGVWR